MNYDHRSIALTTMNILDGMDHHVNWELLQAAWSAEGFGFIEFCDWITQIAERSEQLLAVRTEQDFLGVFDYEVSYKIGELVVNHVQTKGELPGLGTVTDWLKSLMDSFFAKGEGHAG